MCDYSLELYRSRPATQEEQYTLHRFPSGTMERVQRPFSMGPAEVVTMTRLEVTGHAHRDAVRFGNGREVLLQSLNAGVTCTLAPRDLDKVLGLETTTPDLVE